MEPVQWIKWEGEANGVGMALVMTMALDNGMINRLEEPVVVSEEQATKLVAAIKEMEATGFKFTNSIVEEIVSGEQMEVFEKFSDISGFNLLSETLNDIFDNNLGEYYEICC
jgi:hypothetical protein